MYDFANSAFYTSIMSVVFPLYFAEFVIADDGAAHERLPSGAGDARADQPRLRIRVGRRVRRRRILPRPQSVDDLARRGARRAVRMDPLRVSLCCGLVVP